MSSLDSSNNVDSLHIFQNLTKPQLLLDNSLFETIRLIKKHMVISKNRNKRNVIYPIEREPDE